MRLVVFICPAETVNISVGDFNYPALAVAFQHFQVNTVLVCADNISDFTNQFPGIGITVQAALFALFF